MTDLSARSFEAVFFDLDGTLIDSTESVVRCWHRWAEEFGVELGTLAHGLPARAQVEARLPADLVDRGTARIAELEIADTDGILALPGTVEALAAIPSARWAIVTSCPDALAKARLAAAGVTAPRVLVTVDRVRRGKPDPEGFLLAASELGVDPSRCLVVEDAPAGLAAGAAAGCARLALATTITSDRLVADLVVDTLADVRFASDDDGQVQLHLR